MFTDMVGYTSLMQRDEILGMQRRKRHREVFQKQHAVYQGEIIQYFGDGTLSIFSNSVDAVKCAIAMQKELKSPIEVPLRIGIHSGNIILEKDGILGDAVNIASRIESFGHVGGVLISDAVHYLESARKNLSKEEIKAAEQEGIRYTLKKVLEITNNELVFVS